MDVDRAVPGLLTGTIRTRRVGRWRFPVEELTADGRTVAQLGRNGSIRIFFGPGRRVRLEDGTEWRIKAATSSRHIVPVIRSSKGTIAISGPLHAKRSYGINGKDFAYYLIPLDRSGLRRPGQWALRRHETEVALIHDRSHTVEAVEPVPLAAILMAFTLMTHGIPGEANMTPRRD